MDGKTIQNESVSIDEVTLRRKLRNVDGMNERHIDETIIKMRKAGIKLITDIKGCSVLQKKNGAKVRVIYTFNDECDWCPYQSGWVEVYADSIEETHEKFNKKYPSDEPYMLNCSWYYENEKHQEYELKRRNYFYGKCNDVIR